MADDHHVVSTTESQVWLVPTEHDGKDLSADDAEERVRREHMDDQPHHIYYEGKLSDGLEAANRDGIALIRD
jgi:hypothetical protein